MKKVSVNLYKFNELSSEAQKKAIENNRNIRMHNDFDWHEYIFTDYKQRIDRFFEVGKWYYSGFSSQGDGAMFEYSNIRRPLVVAAIKSLKNITDRERKILLAHLYVYGHAKQHGHYYHEKSALHNIELQWNEQTAEQSDRHENLLALLIKVWSDIELFILQQYVRMAKRLYRLLEEGYEAETSDENIKRELTEGDNWFLESGQNAPFYLLTDED